MSPAPAGPAGAKPAPAKKPGTAVATRPKLLELFASKFSIEPEQMLRTLAATAFRVKASEPAATLEELVQLVAIANHYNLNPFLREIYAFRNTRTGGIVPIVGVDGWIRMMHAQPDFEGQAFEYGEDDIGGQYIDCTIHHARRKPTVIREYLKENVRDTQPWKDMPMRMLRHRALIQAIRVAYGFGGIYEPDEGEVIAIAEGVELIRPTGAAGPKVAEPQATSEKAGPADAEQLKLLRAAIDKSGVPDNQVLAHYEIGTFEELRSDQIADAIEYVKSLAP